VLGTIEVDHNEISPNLLKNKFKNNTEYRCLVQDISVVLEGIAKEVRNSGDDHEWG
jgi:hypothetical protein